MSGKYEAAAAAGGWFSGRAKGEMADCHYGCSGAANVNVL